MQGAPAEVRLCLAAPNFSEINALRLTLRDALAATGSRSRKAWPSSQQIAQHPDKTRGRTFLAALDVDPRAFEKQKHFVRQKLRVAIPRGLEKFYEIGPLAAFIGFDQSSRGMFGVKLDCGICDGAATFELIRQDVFDVIDPGIEALLRIAGVFRKYPLPDLVAFVCELFDIGHDQIFF